MKKYCLLLLLPVLAMTFMLQSCASLVSFQDGRTVGQGNFEITASASVNRTPRFEEDFEIDSLNVPSIFIPVIEVMGTYGVIDRLDVYLKLNTFFNVSVGTKFQFLQNTDAMPIALAAGLEFGTFGLLPNLGNVQVPLYLSVHPSEKFTIYASPRYVYQFFGGAGGISYLGGNGGLMFGNRNKFGLEVGYYNLGASGESVGLLQVGIGGKFLLGGR